MKKLRKAAAVLKRRVGSAVWRTLENTGRIVRKGLCSMGQVLRSLAILLRKNAGRIAYYGLVIVALCAIARAAEIYRGEADAPDKVVLPAVDVLLSEAEDPEEPVLELPDDWHLVRGFSEVPQWQAARGLWEAHPAVDYVCEGGVTRSLCDGVVCTVGESGVYGGFVEVKREDGMLLRYASIAPAEEIEAGMQVSAGEFLGNADASMPGEAEQGAHLHLELYVDGEAANPTQYASESTAAD